MDVRETVDVREAVDVSEQETEFSEGPGDVEERVAEFFRDHGNIVLYLLKIG